MQLDRDSTITVDIQPYTEDEYVQTFVNKLATRLYLFLFYFKEGMATAVDGYWILKFNIKKKN